MGETSVGSFFITGVKARDMMGHGLGLQDDGHRCQFSEMTGQLLSPVPSHYASLLAIYLPSIQTLKNPLKMKKAMLSAHCFS